MSLRGADGAGPETDSAAPVSSAAGQTVIVPAADPPAPAITAPSITAPATPAALTAPATPAALTAPADPAALTAPAASAASEPVSGEQDDYPQPTANRRSQLNALGLIAIQGLGLLLGALLLGADPSPATRQALSVATIALIALPTSALFAMAARRAHQRRMAMYGWSAMAVSPVIAAMGLLLHALGDQDRPPELGSAVAACLGALVGGAGIGMLLGERLAQIRHRLLDAAPVALAVVATGLAVLPTASGRLPGTDARELIALACLSTFTVTAVAATLMPTPGPRRLAAGAGLITLGGLIGSGASGGRRQALAVLISLAGFTVCSLAALPVGLGTRSSDRLTARPAAGLPGGALMQLGTMAVATAVVAVGLLGGPVTPLAGLLALAAVLSGVSRSALSLGTLTAPMLMPRRRSIPSRTDDLTGLANMRAVSEALAGPARDPEVGGWPGGPDRISLLLVDLDRFKEINDAFGHHFGDQLLTAVGIRIGAALRPPDLLARLGGDEFVVVLPGVPVERAEEIARTLQRCLENPFVLGGHRLHVRASVGIASCRLHDDQPADLLRRADVAMDAAKASMSGTAVYDPGQDRSGAARIRRIDELRRALEHGDLEVHLQPQVNLHTGTLTGAEALARWRHPQDGVLLPDSFLPLAAQTGLMRPVAALVLDRALAACATWWLRGHHLPVGVNLTADDLRDPALPALVTESLNRHLLPPGALRVEITEEALLHDPAATATLLARWRADGVSVAIDDYGTGYSSLAYLRELPVDEIKLDRAFVRDLDRRTAIIVRHTVAMAHGLSMRVVAEGVEDAATARALADLGCDIGQGLYFGGATGAADFVQRVRHQD